MKKKAKKVLPHGKTRSSCDHCMEPGHEYIEGTGNSHRFHGDGAWKRTHCNTPHALQKYKTKGYCDDDILVSALKGKKSHKNKKGTKPLKKKKKILGIF